MKLIKSLSLAAFIVFIAGCATTENEVVAKEPTESEKTEKKEREKLCHSTGSRLSKRNCIKAN